MMKKRIIAVLLSGVIVFASCQPIWAAELSITPYVAIAHCPQCGVGSISCKKETMIESSCSLVPCLHPGKTGYDIEASYILRKEYACDTCSYTHTVDAPTNTKRIIACLGTSIIN